MSQQVLRFALKAIVPAVLLAMGSAQAATFEITSRDAENIGFNDPTVVAPVGGNPGTTLGAQRLHVYQYVAGIWGAALESPVKITVSAGWEALTCTASSAVLGSAGSWNGWIDFPGAPKTGVWYPQALANKLSGRDLAAYFEQADDGTGYGNVDIKTQFNVNLGTAGCLPNSKFYLGTDGVVPAGQINFVATLLHELGHGLGFSLFTTSSSTGDRYIGLPSVWEGFMFDNTIGKTWLQMTKVERVASAINNQKLAWNGNVATALAPFVLAAGTIPTLTIGGPGAGAAAGNKALGEADFGPKLSPTPVTGQIAQLIDQTNINSVNFGRGLACTPLSAANAALVAGKIAMVDRGTCDFNLKAKNVQDAGALAALVVDNVVQPIAGLGGTNPAVTIPAVRMLKVDGDAIKAQLANRKRGQPVPVITATLVAPLSGMLAGADSSNRPLLYTPNPLQPGSSVSHWDTSATPSLLMEPAITGGLTTVLTAPKDLTVPLLKDIGW